MQRAILVKLDTACRAAQLHSSNTSACIQCCSAPYPSTSHTILGNMHGTRWQGRKRLRAQPCVTAYSVECTRCSASPCELHKPMRSHACAHHHRFDKSLECRPRRLRPGFFQWMVDIYTYPEAVRARLPAGFPPSQCSCLAHTLLAELRSLLCVCMGCRVWGCHL